jgi:3-oxoacyl-[acyl-carrier protein] reductase
MGPLWTTGDSDWEQVLRINLLAPIALCRAFVPWMQTTGGGSIVNLSGGGATGPRGYFAPYAASKAALVRVTETLAEECAGTGVRVNAVAPGAINTAMLDEVLAAGPEKAGAKEYLAATRRKEQGGDDPERAAACIRWLAGPESAPITGRLISAVWDRWEGLHDRAKELATTDIYTLRRVSAKDRGKSWDPV